MIVDTKGSAVTATYWRGVFISGMLVINDLMLKKIDVLVERKNKPGKVQVAAQNLT